MMPFKFTVMQAFNDQNSCHLRIKIRQTNAKLNITELTNFMPVYPTWQSRNNGSYFEK